MSDIPTSSWVTVAEAADRAGVDSGTVRQWYRAGKLPTRRAEGARGAFLVPLAGVLEVAPATPNGAIREPASELVQQVDFLRDQLAELSEENRVLRQRLHDEEERRADLRARLADTEDELTELRRVAARSSITDSSWLDQQTPAYESPVRPQGMAAAADVRPTVAPAKAPAPPSRPPSVPGELADLLAATRPDGEEDDVTITRSAGVETDDIVAGESPFRASVGPHSVNDDADEEARFVPPRPVPSTEPVAYGTHEDDLLPEPEKKGRRGDR
jgi:hypothetical protein